MENTKSKFRWAFVDNEWIIIQHIPEKDKWACCNFDYQYSYYSSMLLGDWLKPYKGKSEPYVPVKKR